MPSGVAGRGCAGTARSLAGLGSLCRAWAAQAPLPRASGAGGDWPTRHLTHTATVAGGVAGVAALGYAWASTGIPELSQWACYVLVAAALGGLGLLTLFHLRKKPLPVGGPAEPAGGEAAGGACGTAPATQGQDPRQGR